MIKIELTTEQLELLNSLAQQVVTKDGKYYFLPYWFYRRKGNSTFNAYSFELLPQELLDMLDKERNSSNNVPEEYKNRILSPDESYEKPYVEDTNDATSDTPDDATAEGNLI